MSNVLILGGDGYLGWPTAMNLSMQGYDVTVADNYTKRDACVKLDVAALYPVPTLVERAKLWYELTGKEIKVAIGNLQDPEMMRGFFNGRVTYAWAINKNFSGIPETVIHYAEQASQPYSMLNYTYANQTLQNNLLVTNNLMFAMRDYSRDTHMVKLGTMGEYGAPNIDIEEGWLDVEHNGRKQKFLYPRQGGSVYQVSKVMDTDLLWLGVRMWGLKVTDLMQGAVYGIETEESKIDSRLNTMFTYDEVFGTIINRFITQAVAGHPLTVYGSGGQMRGMLNIQDTLQCVSASVNTPAKNGELRIFNQIMEKFSISELAEMTKKVGDSLGYNVEITKIPNPRKEAENHYFNPKYQKLLDLGVKPHYLTDEVMSRMFKIVNQYKNNIRDDILFKGIIKW